MELKGVFTLVLLSLAVPSYANKSRSPRTLWLDEDGNTSTETDKNTGQFYQLHKGNHDIKRPFFAKRPHDQKGNQLKVISDEEKKMPQNFVRRNGDLIKDNYPHQQEILDKKDTPKKLDDIIQVLSDFLEENIEEYLKNYCATRYITQDYRICLLFCILSHQSNKIEAEFPPPFPQNTHSITSSEHGGRRLLQQFQDVKGAMFDQKHLKTKIDQIPDPGSNAKNIPNLIKNTPQRNYEGLKKSKRWTQAPSNLLTNVNISDVSNKTI